MLTLKWLQRWNKERRAEPRGDRRWKYLRLRLALVAERPDLTWDETPVELYKTDQDQP
jgi:hypothetical protein